MPCGYYVSAGFLRRLDLAKNRHTLKIFKGKTMLDKIEELERRFQELEALLSDPLIINNQPEFRKLSREHSDLSPLVAVYRRYRRVIEQIDENKEMLADPEMKDMAEEELKSLSEEKEHLDGEIRLLLLPKDPNDSRNVILEIRAGTGGDESALFSGDLFRMYSRFAEKNRWRVEMLSASESERGGYKEVIASIEGTDVFAKLKYESGTHRVQRVPETEAQGRIHTSACTVAIMAEAEDVDIAPVVSMSTRPIRLSGSPISPQERLLPVRRSGAR
jgi:peptide chain release factor 1